MVTPMMFIAGSQKSAVGLMRTGRDDAKGGSKSVSMVLQRAGHRMGSRLDPEHGMRLSDAFEQGIFCTGGQFVQHMADDKEIAGRFCVREFQDFKVVELLPCLGGCKLTGKW